MREGGCFLEEGSARPTKGGEWRGRSAVLRSPLPMSTTAVFPSSLLSALRLQRGSRQSQDRPSPSPTRPVPHPRPFGELAGTQGAPAPQTPDLRLAIPRRPRMRARPGPVGTQGPPRPRAALTQQPPAPTARPARPLRAHPAGLKLRADPPPGPSSQLIGCVSAVRPRPGADWPPPPRRECCPPIGWPASSLGPGRGLGAAGCRPFVPAVRRPAEGGVSPVRSRRARSPRGCLCLQPLLCVPQTRHPPSGPWKILGSQGEVSTPPKHPNKLQNPPFGKPLPLPRDSRAARPRSPRLPRCGPHRARAPHLRRGLHRRGTPPPVALLRAATELGDPSPRAQDPRRGGMRAPGAGVPAEPFCDDLDGRSGQPRRRPGD